eukprot:CFRG0851T1
MKSKTKDEESPVSVCVVGAGIAGIVTAKWLLQLGLNVTVMEDTGTLGGIWKYSLDPKTKGPCYKYLRTNVSQLTMELSDFPFAEAETDFPQHDTVLDYITEYAVQFNVYERIRYNTRVKSIDSTPDGKWKVTSETTYRDVMRPSYTRANSTSTSRTVEGVRSSRKTSVKISPRGSDMSSESSESFTSETFPDNQMFEHTSYPLYSSSELGKHLMNDISNFTHTNDVTRNAEETVNHKYDVSSNAEEHYGAPKNFNMASPNVRFINADTKESNRFVRDANASKQTIGNSCSNGMDICMDGTGTDERDQGNTSAACGHINSSMNCAAETFTPTSTESHTPDSGKDDEKERKTVVAEIFDRVVVCTGVFSKEYRPDIPGLDSFQGKVIHSRSYDRAFPLFHKKKVLVVGSGSSGVDIALEAYQVAKEVRVSVRGRGAWLQRRFLHGRPYDFFLSRSMVRLPAWLKTLLLSATTTHVWIPDVDIKNYNKDKRPSATGNPTSASSESEWSSDGMIYTPDSGLGSLIQDKHVRVVPTIERCSKRRAYFSDGSSYDCDVIVFCTGYTPNNALMPERLVDRHPGTHAPILYEHVWPPKSPGLAYVGQCHVYGSSFPVLELQARWVSYVFSGMYGLGNSKDILRMAVDQSANVEVTHGVRGVTDCIQYQDRIGSILGVNPFGWNNLQDIWLWPYLFVSTSTAWHYRLVASHCSMAGNSCELSEEGWQSQLGVASVQV